MDLEEFVRESLVQIAKGIQAAQDSDASRAGAIFNPQILMGSSADPITTPKEPSSKHVLADRLPTSVVEFDVAVVASQEGATKGEGGAKLKVSWAGIDVGGGGSKESRSSAGIESRIKFSIRVAWPVE